VPSTQQAVAPGDDHAASLQAFSRPGGPLSADSPHATINNPRWFLRRRGRPTALPIRRALHRQLLASWRANAEVASDKRAIVLAGPPGAGKSTVLRTLLNATGTPADQWRVINSDDFKDLILRATREDGSYDELVPPAVAERQAAGERFWPRELAALVG